MMNLVSAGDAAETYHGDMVEYPYFFSDHANNQYNQEK